MPNRADSQGWLLEQFAARLASAVETMTGERPAIEFETANPPAGVLAWYQPFDGASGAVWLSVAEADFKAIGGHILKAAGLEDADAETIKSTYFETVSQVLAGLAQAMSGRLNSEVTLPPGREKNEQDAAAAALDWSRAAIKLPQLAAVVYIGFENALLDCLAPAETPAEVREIVSQAPALTSKTFDLLLDVELPVSVSFGRAQVQLKDVLKLTTGSIVELNRSITEPVEVIVNNCVIARGEVVVVEGNFGVRIQNVVSRQERLRTLH